MKVGELIEALRHMPPDLEVVYPSRLYDEGYRDFDEPPRLVCAGEPDLRNWREAVANGPCQVVLLQIDAN